MKKGIILLIGACGILVFLGLRIQNISTENHRLSSSEKIKMGLKQFEVSDPIQGSESTKIITGSTQIDLKVVGSSGDQKEIVFHDPSRIRDPEYLKLLNRHFELKSYIHSEAKDTVQFAEIESLLKSFGYDEQYVRTAYDAAYEYHIDIAETPEFNVSGNSVQALEFSKVRKRAKTGLNRFKLNIAKRKLFFQGITNSVLVDQLLEIQPTKFFGQREMHANKGEQLILTLNKDKE